MFLSKEGEVAEHQIYAKGLQSWMCYQLIRNYDETKENLRGNLNDLTQNISWGALCGLVLPQHGI